MHRHATRPASPLQFSALAPPHPLVRIPADYAADRMPSTCMYPQYPQILTFGEFRALIPAQGIDDNPWREVSWKSPQSRLLLKGLLAARGHHLSTEQAIELLFPESDPAWSRKRLRDVLSKLRFALQPDAQAYGRSAYVVSDRESIQLVVAPGSQGSGGLWLDCVAFEQLGKHALDLLERGGGGFEEGMAALAIYRGPFLPLDLYSEWAKRAQDRYQRLWTRLVRRMAYSALAERRFAQAIACLERLLDERPYDQDAAYLAMIAYVGADRRGAALEVFTIFAERHEYEADTAHRIDLDTLHERIRSGASKAEILELI